MRLLVTGAHGQVARSLEERSGGRGVTLIFASRPQTDLAQAGAIAAAIRDAAPDVVINAAAYTNVDLAETERELAFRVNAAAAAEAAEAAASVGAPIIQLSTDYVFDGAADRPWGEDDPVNPVNVYGASKAAGEEGVRARNPRHVIVRTSWVVSPFGRNFVKTMIEAARSRDLLRVVDDQRGRPTSALDLADALFTIVEAAARGSVKLGSTYHLAGSGEATWYALACEVMDECKRLGSASARVEPVTSAEWPTAAVRPLNSVLDCSRAESDLGIRLRDWRTSVREIVRRLVGSE